MFSFKKIRSQVLKLTQGDSRAQAYKTYLILKMEYNSENQLSIKSTRRRRSTRRLESRVCKFRSLIKNRLVLIAQAYTHTQSLNIVFQRSIV